MRVRGDEGEGYNQDEKKKFKDTLSSAEERQRIPKRKSEDEKSKDEWKIQEADKRKWEKT